MWTQTNDHQVLFTFYIIVIWKYKWYNQAITEECFYGDDKSN